MSASLPRLLELSLASNSSPDKQAGREFELRHLTNPLKKAGALTLHRVATRHEAIAIQLMRRLISHKGLDYLGHGAASSVYRQGNEVLKVDLRSIGRPAHEQEDIKDCKSREFRIIQSHLGSFLLGQEVMIAEHPLGSFDAVQTRQPFIDFNSLELFTQNDTVLNVINLDQACRSHPGLDSALTDFVDQSFKMIETTCQFPDTNGTDNLVISTATTPELVLIDSQPIGSLHAGVQQIIAQQLAALRTGLREVA